MVGATGFEPATSCSRSRRATGLRYAPPNSLSLLLSRSHDAPRRTRTSNLLIRSQMLYPIELWAPKHDCCRFERLRAPYVEIAEPNSRTSHLHDFAHRPQSYFRTKVESR